MTSIDPTRDFSVIKAIETDTGFRLGHRFTRQGAQRDMNSLGKSEFEFEMWRRTHPDAPQPDYFTDLFVRTSADALAHITRDKQLTVLFGKVEDTDLGFTVMLDCEVGSPLQIRSTKVESTETLLPGNISEFIAVMERSRTLDEIEQMETRRPGVSFENAGTLIGDFVKRMANFEPTRAGILVDRLTTVAPRRPSHHDLLR